MVLVSGVRIVGLKLISGCHAVGEFGIPFGLPFLFLLFAYVRTWIYGYCMILCDIISCFLQRFIHCEAMGQNASSTTSRPIQADDSAFSCVCDYQLLDVGSKFVQ